MKNIFQKGSISIFLSVLLVSVLLIISAGIASLMFNQIKMSSQIGHSVVAYYTAEAGAERCLCDIRKGDYDCTGDCSYTNVSLDFNSDAKYTTNYGGLPPIISTGSFMNTSRKIELNW
jgi:hypothetical protein